MARHELVSAIEMGRDRPAADATPRARLLARLAVARARLLEATALRDRRAQELRELLHAALREER